MYNDISGRSASAIQLCFCPTNMQERKLHKIPHQILRNKQILYTFFSELFYNHIVNYPYVSIEHYFEVSFDLTRKGSSDLPSINSKESVTRKAITKLSNSFRFKMFAYLRAPRPENFSTYCTIACISQTSLCQYLK